jgi:hypothetical protein
MFHLTDKLGPAPVALPFVTIITDTVAIGYKIFFSIGISGINFRELCDGCKFNSKSIEDLSQ